MATTFDVNRIGGGTFELVQDPATGRYSYQKVGFTPVKSLTIPELGKTTTAATDTAAAAKSAVEQTTKDQTTELFKSAEGGRGRDIDYTGSMLKQSDLSQEAAKINPQVGMVQPTVGSFGTPAVQQQMTTPQYRSESEKFKTRFDPTQIQPATPKVNSKSITVDSDNNLYKGGVLIGKGNPKTLRVGADGKVYKDGVYIGDGNPKSIRAVTGAEITGATGTDKAAMTSDDAALGISRVEPSATRIAKEADFASGTIPSKEARVPDAIVTGQKGIDPEPTALKKVNTGLKSLSNAVGSVLSSGPISMIAKAITKEPSNIQQLNKDYFNVRDDGRIAGNPATDLYAGFNRTSDFGNLEQAGKKRISTREKTIARKNYGPGDKFYDDTQKMKEQQKDYQRQKAAKQKATQGPAGGATTGGGGGGSDSGSRVICTDLHRTGELSTRDWVRDTKFTFKKLSMQHVKGYLLWAEPTVRHIQKYPRYRKIWKHIAQHRANDIAWRLNEGKFDLLGRIYAGIGEPLCWMLGNFVSDKQINKYNLSHWRRV
jgi:hypothetical protein